MSVCANQTRSIAGAICVMTMLLASGNCTAGELVSADDCGCASCTTGCNEGCSVGHTGGCAGGCSMPPHYMYYPRSHGNYYFRPYNYRTVLYHQQIVGRYGGDPRHPYANTLFKSLYEEVESGAVLEELVIPQSVSTFPAASRRERQPTVTFLNEMPLPREFHAAPLEERRATVTFLNEMPLPLEF